MTDTMKTFRSGGEEGSAVPITRIGLLAGVIVETVAVTSYTLADAHHGKIVNFTSGSSVTVTVPAGLRTDFCCGVTAGGAGTVTFVAGAGATLESFSDQLSIAGQYAMASVCGGFGTDTYRLFGQTA